MSKIVTASNFETEILQSKKPVLVDFHATWCGPCAMMAPILEEVNNSREDFEVAKLDIDEAPDLARKYGVQAVPTLIMFKNGEATGTAVGYMEKEALLNFVEKSV